MIKVRFYWILAFSVYALSLTGQPYALDWKKEAWIAGTGLTFLLTDLGLYFSTEPLSEAEIAQLDPLHISRFDRSATLRNSGTADLRSDIGQWSSFAMAGLTSGLLAYSANRGKGKSGFFHEGLVLGILLVETNLLTLDGTYLLKGGTMRIRPYVYNPDVSLARKRKRAARFSFFSGHTSAAAANTFFAASVFSAYFPDSKWKPLVWTAAVALPAWTGIERYLAGKHFPTDVIAGYAFGAFCGWLVPHLHRHLSPVKVRPFSGGSALGMEMSLSF